MKSDTEVPITVIVPVYGDYAATRACLESVARHADGAVEAELLIVDDETPEPRIATYLDELAAVSPGMPTTLLRNETNQGFVRSVNRALRHCEGDVIVLNSDTIVTEGWLDGLARAASESPDVATVTPLTNSGSICTLPDSVIDSFGLADADPDVDGCAAFVSANSIGAPPEIITAVGFCMYMTRATLDECGLLDEESFGRGYGEEVDWCLRATRLGFRHLASDSVFVFHAGAASFGESRTEGLKDSARVMHSRYPFFKPTLRAENARDPLGPAFTSLELGLHQRDPARPHVMHMLHSDPSSLGGTEHHLGALMSSLGDRFDFSVLFPVDSGFVLHTRWVTNGEVTETEFLLPGAARRPTRVIDPVAATAVRLAIDLFDVDVVHIQNLVGHSLAPLEVLEDFEGTVLCSVRDLYLACPSHSLLYMGREGCGIPDDLDVCAECIAKTVKGATLDTLLAHREAVRRHLDVVDHWVFASQSSHDYFRRAYDLDPDRVEIIPHGALVSIPTKRRAVTPRAAGPLRVAFVGVGWRKKGLDAVNELAESIPPSEVEFHHFGKLRDEASSRLRVHGPYDNERLAELLDANGVDIVLLPGPYAETFGHVMTEALLAGRPVVGATYGALGERIRAAGAGWTIDPVDVDGLRLLLINLNNCPAEVERAARGARDLPVDTVAATSGAYADLYEDGLDLSRRDARAETMTETQAELRRHLRAMAAVNRQLQAQLDTGAQRKRIQKVETRVESLLSRVERLVRKALRFARRVKRAAR